MEKGRKRGKLTLRRRSNKWQLEKQFKAIVGLKQQQNKEKDAIFNWKECSTLNYSVKKYNKTEINIFKIIN